MKLCCSIIMQNRNRKVLKQHAKISLDSVMPQFMMNMNNFLGYFSIALGITFHLEREKLNSMMLRFPPQISNWMWRVEAHFKTTLQTLTNPLLRSSSYAYLFLTQKIGYHDFMAPFLELLLNTVQLSWLSIFWLRKNHHPTQQQQRDHHTQLLSFLFNQNAIIHLKSSNTNRILARKLKLL